MTSVPQAKILSELNSKSVSNFNNPTLLQTYQGSGITTTNTNTKRREISIGTGDVSPQNEDLKRLPNKTVAKPFSNFDLEKYITEIKTYSPSPANRGINTGGNISNVGNIPQNGGGILNIARGRSINYKPNLRIGGGIFKTKLENVDKYNLKVVSKPIKCYLKQASVVPPRRKSNMSKKGKLDTNIIVKDNSDVQKGENTKDNKLDTASSFVYIYNIYIYNIYVYSL